jgi:hypothetical protein
MIGRNEFRLKHLTIELLATTFLAVSLLGPASAQDTLKSTSKAPANDGTSVTASPMNELLKLLPLLLTSDDRKRLATGLEASIRKGDLKAAEDSLNTAIEVGTLAIVLNDHLRDPGLLKALQDLGIHGDASAAPAPAMSNAVTAAACSAPGAPTTANLAELQQALEQEQSYASMISQTLTGLMQEHNTLTARLETETASQTFKASELQKAVQQEQERREAAMRELATLQEEFRALQGAKRQDEAASPSNVSALEALLRQEREQNDRAARQLASVQRELHALQAFKDEATASESQRVAELEKALARAQMKGDALSQELADTGEALRALQEPHRPSATPLVIRLASSGTEAPLSPAQNAEAQALPLPEAKPSPEAARPAPQDVTAALPRREPAPVMIASLPEANQPLPSTMSAIDPAKVEAPPSTTVKVDPPASKADDRLTVRADELFRKGDVSGARLLLERSLASGNARAAFLLAETFDPNILSRLGAMGIRGDVAKAREFYAQAQALGIAQAGERMQALK